MGVAVSHILSQPLMIGSPQLRKGTKSGDVPVVTWPNRRLANVCSNDVGRHVSGFTPLAGKLL